METDIAIIYGCIHTKYPVSLSSSQALDPQCRVDYPVLHGCSALGRFELFYDDVSFSFYVKKEDGTVSAHWHLQSLEEAQKTVEDFMDGKQELQGLCDRPNDSVGQEIPIHIMKLNPLPFAMIKSGKKTIELRLYDEKRQQIKEGDIIVFTNTSNGEKLSAVVKKLHRFDNFEELYKTLPLLQCGYTTENVDKAHPSDMEQYYSAEKQSKYGVVGIELFLHDQITTQAIVTLT